MIINFAKYEYFYQKKMVEVHLEVRMLLQGRYK